MKTNLTVSVLSFALAASSYGKGLYYIPNDTEESTPIAWSVGMDAIWDSNTIPTSPGPADESFSLNPYVGLSFISVTPQTTWNVYSRLGLIYYLDQPAGTGDEFNSASRAGVDLTHRFNERLRFVSRNYAAYELEPDYAYGFATDRTSSEYFFWQTDNALGYRWTERFATYTGIQLQGLDYRDSESSDRLTWTAYNQFRYQLTPQTVGTATYRYSETYGGGVAADSTSHFMLVGVEHRFTPNTILIANAGAQIRESDGPFGSDGTSPYLEVTLSSQVNTQFSVSAFARYGVESFDTVQSIGTPLVVAEYDDRMTLRIGVSNSYQISPDFSVFSGIDLINSAYGDGYSVTTGAAVGDADEFLINAYIGGSLKLTEYLYGTLSYNYTNSDSDFRNSTYQRSRVSLGLRAEF